MFEHDGVKCCTTMLNQRIDKTAFAVVSLAQADDELEYWLTKTPQERLQGVEVSRQILYGYTGTAPDFKEF